MNQVYVVGSWEGQHFIADRVFADPLEAVAYCESRQNPKYDWGVMAAPLGEPWLLWTHVHTTERGERVSPVSANGQT